MSSITADTYSGYEQLKHWNEQPFMRVDDGDRRFYDHYLLHVAVAGEKVLEIGFGNGNFLGWAQSRGAALYGTEIQPSLVAKAEAAGVTVLPLDLTHSVNQLRGQVAVIAAIDVMEHLTRDENQRMLANAAEMLKPGGVMLVRFPNGQSPLSMGLQHGDGTHVSVLSIPIVRQMIIGLPLSVAHAGAQARLPAGGLSSVKRKLQNGLRYLATKAVHVAFGKVDLYDNAVMVLRHT